jgi:glycosyltransferase involved in cell wall biosynthesis
MVNFSVVVSSFNYLPFIGHCIESVLSQDYASLELIVVDDGSTDGSRDLIASYAGAGRIRKVFHDVNKGHGGAVNSGYAEARGDVVLFLDADDFLLPGALTELSRCYSERIAQYQYRMQLVDESGAPFDLFPQPEIPWESGFIAEKVLANGRYNTSVTSGLAFSASALGKVLPLDEGAFRQGADGYLTTIVPLYGEILSIDTPLSAYRQHGDNHSQFRRDLIKRARWCLEHDANRYAALRAHAKKLGLMVREPLGDADILHLEQRMVCLLLDPECSSSERERRRQTANLALRALSEQQTPRWRTAALKLWWRGLAVLPPSLAHTLLNWKLDSSSRPHFVTRIAKTIRRSA